MKLKSWLTAVVAALLLETEYSKACNTEGDIRLANGRNKFEGRVEVCQDGQWKTVCNRRWGNREARVVCRQLQFSGDLDPREETDVNVFGEGSGGIVEAEWDCVGMEASLLDCPTVPRDCDHNRDAGVYCFGRNLDNCNEGDIRLRDSDGNSGRVEVCLGGHWGTVCDDGWDSNDAITVCRQLGYTGINIVIPTRGAYFGEGSGPIHLSRAECKNNDTRLIDCTVNKMGINLCVHSEDAGVICIGPSSCGDGDVRLVGGENEREGRVEICYNGVWGTVCDYGWDQVDTNIVCRQLGYGQPATINNIFGVGEGPPLLFNITCNHTHSELSQCVHPYSVGLRDCISQDKRAGVICPELMIELTTTNFSFPSTLVPAIQTRLQLIIPVAGGVMALVVTTAICIILCFIVAMRRKSDTELRDNADTPAAVIGLKENEAYIPVAYDVKTSKNEAYGQVHNNIETQKNEAYGQATQHITTLTNEAYGTNADYYETVS